MEEPILEVRNVSKSYSKSDFQLKDVTFSIPYGTITGFIGENGAGKTTMMGIILGTLHKDRGVIKLFGKELLEAEKEIKEQIGVVFDCANFSPGLDAVRLGRVLRNVYERWNQEKYLYFLDRFSLPSNQKLSGYSRGMSMKLAIAVALSHDARLLILDEATSGLDPVARDEILEVFLDFVSDKRRSILLSSHITSDIEKIADDLIFIKRGEIILQCAKEKLLSVFSIAQYETHVWNELKGDLPDVASYLQKGDIIQALIANKDTALTENIQPSITIDDITKLLMKGERA